MKGLFIAAAAAAMCIPTIGAQEIAAPNPWQGYFGVDAAWEITIPAESGGDALKAGSGFKAGAFYNMPLFAGGRFFFEPGIYGFYNTMGLNGIIPDGGAEGMYSGSVRNAGVRVPFYFGYNFALPGELDLSVATGPVLNVNIMARRYLDPNFVAPAPASVNLFDDGHGWKRTEALWGIKLKLTFAGCYTLGVDGGVGISPLASYGNRDNKIKIRRASVGISLGYNFR